MAEISVQDLQNMRQNNENFQLIDVREPYEYEHSNLGGENIPLAMLPLNLDKIANDKKLILQCRSGGRSAQAAMFLQQKGYKDVYNLRGGMMAWAREIDPSVSVA
ncbi:MAG: rhodanese-like domain-containing protein [Bacteroidetes bacterium]|nr:rhodanese-like domain-containing protein [Bacteroidota bacterium]MCB9044312.1 rhodanese-like domain-containing protein [Chitinophagales bacterium]